MSRKAPILLFSALVVTFGGAACGGDDDPPGARSPSSSSSTAEGRAFPVTLDDAGREVTIDARPERVVSLSATATEMLFAIGAGDQVEAVDSTSNFPGEAPTTDLSAIEPSVEAIAELEPDLVVLSFDPGEVVSGLEAVGVPVLLHESAVSLDETYAQIEQLGAATGRVGDAAEVVGAIQSELEAIARSVEDRPEPLRYYYEIDDTFFTATSASFIGQVLGLLGLENIADPADDGSGFPQLSAEVIINEDPDLIFLADTKCCGQSAETVAARPGWASIRAVEQGAVVELDDDIASRWGPRVVDLAEQAAEAVRVVPVGTR